MKLSVSILNLKEPKQDHLKTLLNNDLDFIHLDLMDGNFVPTCSTLDSELKALLQASNVPLDIHFMVSDVRAYAKEFASLNPTFMTFHLEAVASPDETIAFLHSFCKVGISIKPDTKVEALLPYLDRVDLVLLMSVEPGQGGQAFLPSVLEKIAFLKEYRKEQDLSFQIEVDGGINDRTISLVRDVDMVVVGSFITQSEDSQKQIALLKDEWAL